MKGCVGTVSPHWWQLSSWENIRSSVGITGRRRGQRAEDESWWKAKYRKKYEDRDFQDTQWKTSTTREQISPYDSKMTFYKTEVIPLGALSLQRAVSMWLWPQSFCTSGVTSPQLMQVKRHEWETRTREIPQCDFQAKKKEEASLIWPGKNSTQLIKWSPQTVSEFVWHYSYATNKIY